MQSWPANPWRVKLENIMATTIDKSFLKLLRPEIDAALSVIAAKHGLQSLRCGNGSYDPHAGSFSFKLEGLGEGAMGKEAALYTSSSAAFLGLPPLGTAFRSSGVDYKTAGLNSSGSKVICERADGKKYLFTVDIVKALCGVVQP